MLYVYTDFVGRKGWGAYMSMEGAERHKRGERGRFVGENKVRG